MQLDYNVIKTDFFLLDTTEKNIGNIKYVQYVKNPLKNLAIIYLISTRKYLHMSEKIILKQQKLDHQTTYHQTKLNFKSTPATPLPSPIQQPEQPSYSNITTGTTGTVINSTNTRDYEKFSLNHPELLHFKDHIQSLEGKRKSEDVAKAIISDVSKFLKFCCHTDIQWKWFEDHQKMLE